MSKLVDKLRSIEDDDSICGVDAGRSGSCNASYWVGEAADRIEELESQLELERRMHKRTTKYLNDANLDIDLRQAISDGFSGAMMEAEKERDGLKKILETIDGLHVFKGDELVKTFNGNYVSPDDFVSATELQAILNREKAE